MFARISLAAVLLTTSATLAADWPQWRGPDRSNVSAETGLLSEWPKDGPPLAWKATGLGNGVAPVSVAGGRVFTTGSVGEDMVCTALGAKDGKPLWAAKLGPPAKESAIMRWLGQMAPTVDGDRVYAVTSMGDCTCLAADTGKVIWKKHYQTDFAGKSGPFGFCDYPLVDGDKLIVCPGGSKHTVAVLDKMTGKLLWSCSIPGEAASYSVPIAAEIGGVKQYVVHLGLAMYGISTDGKQLWKYDGMRGSFASYTHAPIAHGDTVFYASGYNAGHALLKLGKTGDTWEVKEQYRGKHNDFVPWLGSPTRVGDHVFITTQKGLRCLEAATGKVSWDDDTLGRCMYTVADGKLLVRTQKGQMILAAAGPKGFRAISEFTPPRPDKGAPAWTYPVVADGHLFVRDYDTLLCYDLRDPDRPRKKVPDAVFVPTPADVVGQMLDLAGVKKDDVVYDLGSGDGRVVIAAAKAFGCKAVGVELDKELVILSRDKAKAAGVEKRVTFRHEDLFEADFSDATVVALYLLPAMNKKLAPKLDGLKPGARVVAHAFPIPGMVPDKVVKITSDEDDIERPVYLYTVPLKKEK